MMATMKITKKHHKHLNNPFPSTPKSLSLVHGSLSFNPHTLPSSHVYSIGTHFQLLWSSINGGHVSISHTSQPRRSIWGSVPGQAFVSAAVTLIKYHRSEELLIRWMELSAFTTVFRTHEGNKPACNSQFYSNHNTLSHFARLAKVFKAWTFYRIQLVKEASQKGLPVCRHLFLHYPEDEYVHKLTYQQFLVGSEILVAPVLDKGRKDAKVYFPIEKSCSWVHIWTGKQYPSVGVEARVEAPLGHPAVFVKSGSVIGHTFLKNLEDLCIL